MIVATVGIFLETDDNVDNDNVDDDNNADCNADCNADENNLRLLLVSSTAL